MPPRAPAATEIGPIGGVLDIALARDRRHTRNTMYNRRTTWGQRVGVFLCAVLALVCWQPEHAAAKAPVQSRKSAWNVVETVPLNRERYARRAHMMRRTRPRPDEVDEPPDDSGAADIQEQSNPPEVRNEHQHPGVQHAPHERKHFERQSSPGDRTPISSNHQRSSGCISSYLDERAAPCDEQPDEDVCDIAFDTPDRVACEKELLQVDRCALDGFDLDGVSCRASTARISSTDRSLSDYLRRRQG